MCVTGLESHFKYVDNERGARRIMDTNTSEKDEFINSSRRYMDHLAAIGKANVVSYPAKGDIFHLVEIDGICFRGAVGIDGPAIIRHSSRLRGHEEGWVQLGVSGIYHTPQYSPYIAIANQTDPIGYRWHVCKYGPNEERINIDDMTIAGRYALAYEFGINLHPPLPDEPGYSKELLENYYGSGEWFLFYLSPAFRSLCEWTKKHPRIAKNCRGSYLGDWPTAARIGEYQFERSKS